MLVSATGVHGPGRSGRRGGEDGAASETGRSTGGSGAAGESAAHRCLCGVDGLLNTCRQKTLVLKTKYKTQYITQRPSLFFGGFFRGIFLQGLC